MSRSAKALIVVAVLVVMNTVAFLYRVGRHDSEALRDFTASYEHFERTVAILAPGGSASTRTGSANASVEKAAGDALVDVQSKALMRISSLTTNDGSIMRAARDVSRLATQELVALRAYNAVAADTDAGRSLATQFAMIQRERRRTYSRFLILETAPPNTPY